VPTFLLKEDHPGAGLVSVFQEYRHRFADFQNEVLFRAFLLAFRDHVKLTLSREDSKTCTTRWWAGGLGNGNAYYVDSSDGNAQREFDEAGRLSLARNLAADTYRIISDHTAGIETSPFLMQTREIEVCPKVVGWRENQLEGVSVSVAEEDLPIRKRPGYAISKKQDYKERGQKGSKTILKKRPPELSPRAIHEKDRNAQNSRARRARQKVVLVQKEAKNKEMGSEPCKSSWRTAAGAVRSPNPSGNECNLADKDSNIN
jgi:hypothetical protein